MIRCSVSYSHSTYCSPLEMEACLTKVGSSPDLWYKCESLEVNLTALAGSAPVPMTPIHHGLLTRMIAPGVKLPPVEQTSDTIRERLVAP